MTSPFHFYGEKFEILADAEKLSDIKIALFAHFRDKEPIDGYGFEDAVLESGEGGYCKIRFAKPLLDLDSKNPCIVIKSNHAMLYAIRGELIINASRYM